MARYYDPRTAAFCSADPVGGDPSDPESWNRYVYARDNPINLTDPSGQFWLWDALEIIGMVVADVLTGGSSQLAFEAGSAMGDIFDLESLLSFGETVHALSNEGQQKRQHPQLPPPLMVPPGYRPCPPVPWIITPIRKRQAPGREPTRMNSHIPGSASIDPRQVGLDYPGPNDLSKNSLDRRDKTMRNFPKSPPILLQPIDPLPTGAPNGPWVVRGVGDKNVRSSDVPWADIRVGNNKASFKISIRVSALLPKNRGDLSCPK